MIDKEELFELYCEAVQSISEYVVRISDDIDSDRFVQALDFFDFLCDGRLVLEIGPGGAIEITYPKYYEN